MDRARILHFVPKFERLAINKISTYTRVVKKGKRRKVCLRENGIITVKRDEILCQIIVVPRVS